MGRLAPMFERREGLASGEYNNGGTLTNPASWLVSLIGSGPHGRTTAGVDINEYVAEGMPAVYACVHVISETVGQLPLKLYRRTERGREPDTSHPLYTLLHDLPNPEMTALQFQEIVTRHLALWGRAYAQIERDKSGEVVALWPLHPRRMFVDRDGLNRKRFRYWMGKGEYREFLHDPNRPAIMHLHMNSEDGLDGRSPVWINRESLGITKAAEDFVGAWFGNGAVPGLVMSHPGKLSDKAKENLRRSWTEKFMGARKSNKVAILEEGIKLDVVGANPQKSQLDQLRNAQIEAAARIWRVPLFMIQNQTKDTSWGSGIEQQMLGFVNVTLMPYFEQWQQAIARDLLTRKSFNTHYAKFVFNALVRGDIKARFDAYHTARLDGVINADEWREFEDMNAIEGGAGQVYWRPENMAPVVGDGTPVGMDPEPEPATVVPAPERTM